MSKFMLNINQEPEKKKVACFIVPFLFQVMPTGSTFTFIELCSGALRGAVRAAVLVGVWSWWVCGPVTRGTLEQEPQSLENGLLHTLFSNRLNSSTLIGMSL